jgi:hypothetical protein
MHSAVGTAPARCRVGEWPVGERAARARCLLSANELPTRPQRMLGRRHASLGFVGFQVHGRLQRAPNSCSQCHSSGNS